MKQILVIDDDDNVRESIAISLSTYGFTAITASSGIEALALLGRGLDPGLIFCDLIMSEMSGGQFLAEYFKIKGPGCPVVLMSAVDMMPQIPGVTHVIKKPFDLELLIKVANTYCQRVPVLIDLQAEFAWGQPQGATV